MNKLFGADSSVPFVDAVITSLKDLYQDFWKLLSLTLLVTVDGIVCYSSKLLKVYADMHCCNALRASTIVHVRV